MDCLVCRLVEVRDAIVDLRSQQEKDRQEFRVLEQQIAARYNRLRMISTDYTHTHTLRHTHHFNSQGEPGFSDFTLFIISYHVYHDHAHHIYHSFIIMSPLRRHIFVCFMAKSAFWRGFSALAPYTGVGPI